MKAPKPPEEQQNPLLPAGMDLHVMEDFQGINHATSRMGVPDQQCYWIDGFIPIEKRNLRTLYSNGPAIFQTGDGVTIVCFYFANIGDQPIAVVFLSDGGVIQLNLITNVITQILPAASVINVQITTVGVAQWGQQYVIIVSAQPNGYWLWDGALLFQAGTLSPTIILTDPGNSYQTVPAVVLSGGTGSGATAVATIAGGFVNNVVVTNPGSGYTVGDVVTATFIGGTSGGTGAVLVAVMSSSPGGSGAVINLTMTVIMGGGAKAIDTVTIISGGSGYSQYATATVVGFTPFTTASLELGIVAGVITSVTILNAGVYEIDLPDPTISVGDPGVFVVSSVTVSSGGSGYSASTALAVSGGDTANPQATLKPVLSGGVITSVVVLQGGSYASASPLPSIAISDVPATATATVELMPFGVQGTTVETYSQRVWVGNGPHFYFTAPGSFTDFATTSGGGNQTSGDSYLRVKYTRFLNTNGFLFMIADSSVSYVSGVQTNSVGDPPVPVTTFTYQNADPQVGTPYPLSVQAFGRSIMLANVVGIYQGNGGDFVKISDPLDTAYYTVANFGGLQISSAQAIIFGRKVFMELVQLLDPVSGAIVNKLLMWNSKFWFASEQDVTLTFINSNEINSVLTAYGTDGTRIYPLFTTPSATLQKIVQSKYWDSPTYALNKAVNRFFGIIQYYDVTAPDISLDVDNEVINSHYTITGPGTTGVFIVPPQAVGQQGVLSGMTIKTNCKDLAIVSMAIDSTNVGYRG